MLIDSGDAVDAHAAAGTRAEGRCSIWAPVTDAHVPPAPGRERADRPPVHPAVHLVPAPGVRYGCRTAVAWSGVLGVGWPSNLAGGQCPDDAGAVLGHLSLRSAAGLDSSPATRRRRRRSPPVASAAEAVAARSRTRSRSGASPPTRGHPVVSTWRSCWLQPSGAGRDPVRSRRAGG
ncbi:hypothetical protein HBB16_18415 [Pseudonocardia sp. MCCB 268]|nr:hypothetical protein [Pseudonocardia cytotoxica]